MTKNIRLMLIEDSKLDSLLFQKNIADRDLVREYISYETFFAAEAYLTENIYKPEEMPDVIALDLFLQDESGLDFLRFLDRSGLSQIKVIVVTASKILIDVEAISNHPNVVAILDKPVDYKLFMSLC